MAVVAVLAAAACGGGDDGEQGSDVEAGPPSAIGRVVPAGVSTALVVAGDDEGWVLAARRGDAGRGVRAYRLGLDGRVAAVAEVPALASSDAVPVDGGLVVAGLECSEGGLPDPASEGMSCGSHHVRLVRLGEDGSVAGEATILPLDRGIDSGDGLSMVGSDDGSVWVSTTPGLAEVASDGTVVRQVDSSGGAEWVLGGELVALVDPALAERDGPPGGPEEMVTLPAGGGPTARRFEARRWSGDTWEVVADSGRDFTAGGYPQVLCAAGGLEVADPDGALLAGWAPATGWVDPPAAAPPPDAALEDDSEGSGAFAVTADGSVLARAATGRYEDTRLDLPVPDGPPPVVAIDRSSSVTVGCVTQESLDRGVTTTCDIGEAP